MSFLMMIVTLELINKSFYNTLTGATFTTDIVKEIVWCCADDELEGNLYSTLEAIFYCNAKE